MAQLPTASSSFSAVPAKKPAISVRGKCLPHTEGRFRVEVGYHAELIAVFKSIPSKNYGKRLCCARDTTLSSCTCRTFYFFVSCNESCSALDPATKMWNFGLEDHQHLSMRDIYKRVQNGGRRERVFSALPGCYIFVASLLQWRGLLLLPLCL